MAGFIYEREGFTLVEILIAITIMGLVVGGAISIYLMSITAWKEGSVQIALQREGSLAMEKMVRGLYGRNGIREAQSVVIPNANTIRYTSGVDGVERSFSLDVLDIDNDGYTDEIFYNPDSPVINGNEVFIVEKKDSRPNLVVGLTFAVSGSIVTINLGMQDKVRGKDINVDLSTSVKLRN